MIENRENLNLVYFARLHWIIFLGPVLSVLICCVLLVEVSLLREPTLIMGAFALLWVAMTWVNYYFSSVSILKKQVILRTGVIVRQTIDIPLAKIETIDIRQSLVGSLFKYGTLVIIGTGGTRHLINFLQRPLTCRRYIEQLMNDH
ncbi:MAG: PH domain-containing protein [Legionellales bacterium]